MYTTTSPLDFLKEIFYNIIMFITEDTRRKTKKKRQVMYYGNDIKMVWIKV